MLINEIFKSIFMPPKMTKLVYKTLLKLYFNSNESIKLWNSNMMQYLYLI